MSETFRQFIAGLVRHTRELTLLLAPNVNSYKRFVRGSFAPTALVWGHDNRTCALRVVGHGQGHARREPRGRRRRQPVPGLRGAARRRASPASTGSTSSAPPGRAPATRPRDEPHVPSTLHEARELFAGSALAREALGDEVVDHYLNAATVELDAFDAAVTDWELQPLLRAPVSRPRIGICAYRTHARWTHWELEATVIPQGYVEGVRLAGGVPILLPPTPEGAEDPGEVLDGIDGLVLTGGPDLDPALYGAELEEGTDEPTPERQVRDAFELALLREARRARAAGARHLPRPAADERASAAARSSRTSAAPSSTSRRTVRSSARSAAIA